MKPVGRERYGNTSLKPISLNKPGDGIRSSTPAKTPLSPRGRAPTRNRDQPRTAKPAQVQRALPFRARAPRVATETMRKARVKVALAHISLAFRKAAKPTPT